MAVIPIDRKARLLWPWILLGLLVLGLLAWWLLGARTPERDVAAVSPAAPMVAALPAAVERLARFAEGQRGAMGPSHDYTADGLRHVADALEAVRGRAPADVDVAARAREIRERADAMQRDPTSTAHALQAREAFVLATSTLRQMRPGTGNDPVAEAHAAAVAVDPQTRLLDQPERVQRFFATTAAALRQIAG